MASQELHIADDQGDTNLTNVNSLQATSPESGKIANEQEDAKSTAIPSLQATSSEFDNKRFRFELLPAEIRNMIYSLTLTRLVPIRVKCSANLTREKYANIRGLRLCPALLLVSPQVCAEAVGALYSKNQFVFNSLIILRHFLSTINGGVAYLTDVTVNSISSDSTVTAEVVFMLLKPARSLKRLCLQGDDAFSAFMGDKIWKAAIPFLRAVSFHDGMPLRDPVDMLFFEKQRPGTFSNPTSHERKHIPKNLSDMRKAIREALPGKTKRRLT